MQLTIFVKFELRYTISKKKNFSFSNVLIGEHVVGTNPDCIEGSTSCLPSVQDIEVESVTVHEGWDKVRFAAGNDIALVRMARPAILSYVRFRIQIHIF